MPLEGYHRTPNANWRQAAALEGNYVGIELETLNRQGNARTVRAVDNGPNLNGIIPACEHDASIDHYNGVEVITPPIPLATAIRRGGWLHRLVTALVDAGVEVNPPINYGMHINVNVRGWSENEVNSFLVGIFMLKSSAEVVGGRAHGGAGLHDTWRPRVEIPNNSFRVVPQGKYFAAHRRAANPNVVEIRYPLAIMDFARIKANISFVYSTRKFISTDIGKYLVRVFAKMLSNGYNVDRLRTLANDAYLNWLSRQRTFRNLYAIVSAGRNNIPDKTFEEIKENARAFFAPLGAAAQDAAQQWCLRIA